MFESLLTRVIQQAPEDHMTVSPQHNILFIPQEQPDGATSNCSQSYLCEDLIQNEDKKATVYWIILATYEDSSLHLFIFAFI